MKKRMFLYLFAAAVILAIYCSPSTSVSGGSGSEVEVVGYIYNSNGGAAALTQVRLIPWKYEPTVAAGKDSILTDTTDVNGRYEFGDVSPGTYNVQAVQLLDRTRMLISGINVTGDTTKVQADSLETAGAIRLLLPDCSASGGKVFITGTDLVTKVNSNVCEALLDSVPAGLIPEIRYVNDSGSMLSVRKNVVVRSSDTISLADLSSKYYQYVKLNTSASGAAVDSNVYGFPVLIKLTPDNFDFSQAKNNGTDIRFTTEHGKPLPFEIETWDAAVKSAAIWVKTDTIFGNDSTQAFLMSWGDSSLPDMSDSRLVFDTAAGFQGVWHFDEKGNDVAIDATANGFTGNAYHMSGTAAQMGAIGNARIFDGDSGYITMPNTAGGKLNFAEDGSFTLSAWVYADTFDNVYRTIVAKGFEQYFLQLTYFPSDEPQWEFATFYQGDNWHMSNYKATEKKWMLITGVKSGDSQYLYCDGELVTATSAVYPQSVDRDTTENLSVGRFLKEATYPAKFGYCYFKGKIDEVRICSMARNAYWIKLCYMNQRSDDRLVNFRK